jgi:hypothetical protein
MLWAEMKNFVREKFCKTPEEVAMAIHEFRDSLTPEKCQRYINKINEVTSFFINSLKKIYR